MRCCLIEGSILGTGMGWSCCVGFNPGNGNILDLMIDGGTGNGNVMMFV